MLKIGKFNGCGNCPACKHDSCVGKEIPVTITFIKDEYADNCGRFVVVFRKGEKVKAMARVLDDTIHCVTAESNIYNGYSDYVSLDNVVVVGCNIEYIASIYQQPMMFSDYQLVYTDKGEFTPNPDNYPTEELAEHLFTKFNVYRPDDYRGRSMSVGDIIKVTMTDGSCTLSDVFIVQLSGFIKL